MMRVAAIACVALVAIAAVSALPSKVRNSPCDRTRGIVASGGLSLGRVRGDSVAILNRYAVLQESPDAIVPEQAVDTELMQAGNTSASAAQATAAAADQNKVAEEAAAEEAKWTAEETKFAEQAKALNDKEREEAKKAQEQNAAAALQLQNDAVAAAEKVAATNKASAEAEEQYEAMQAKYNKVQADMASADEAAAAKAIADAKAYNESMATLHRKIEAEKAAGKQILENMKTEAANLAARKADIAANFKLTSASLKAQYDKQQTALEEEEREAQANFTGMFKSNELRAQAAAAAIEEEASELKVKANEARNEIDKRYAAQAEANEAAKLAYQNKMAAEALALNQSRAETKELFEKKAAQAEFEFKEAMANASAMNASAHHAEATDPPVPSRVAARSHTSS